MEAVRQWAFAVCAAMVACGLARMVLPKAGMEKIFRATVSVFFLCCLLMPVAVRFDKPGFAFEQSANEDIQRRADRLSDLVWQQADAAAGRDVTELVEEKLAQMGIKYREITINMNINGQREQSTASGSGPEGGGRVNILLDAARENDREQIQEALERQLGLEVQITCAEERPAVYDIAEAFAAERGK